MYKPEHWMQSLEGGAFDLVNTTPDHIDWHTVSLVLGRVPRFGGHTLLGPYSVAQHCVEGARAILRDTGRRDWAAAFLLHDVHEVYIGDIMTPVVHSIVQLISDAHDSSAGAAFSRAIKALKYGIDCAVYAKAGIAWPLDAETAAVVKDYDYRMAITERRDRLLAHPFPWHPTIENRTPIEGCDLTPWGADLAIAMWRGSFRELIGGPKVDIPAPSDCQCDHCAIAAIDASTYRKEKESVWS